MNTQDEKKIEPGDVHDVKEYAEVLAETKKNESLYRLVRVAMASYADGVKSALRCQAAAQTA